MEEQAHLDGAVVALNGALDGIEAEIVSLKGTVPAAVDFTGLDAAVARAQAAVPAPAPAPADVPPPA